MADIRSRLHAVRDQIASHARACARGPEGVRLVAVSKTRPATDVAQALEAGQRDFGENYLQEALPKIEALANRGAVWHYIGRIQSNKTRELAAAFDWVQTVDRLKVAQRLDAQRSPDMLPLNICLQVNIDREPQKAGTLPEDVPALAAAASRLPRLRLRGLMAIPAATGDPARQRTSFSALRELFERLRTDGLELDTLSMGMSGDLAAAITEGSTMVRVGTAIFGPRG